jgi:tRNA-specific 2-thiouridylase
MKKRVVVAMSGGVDSSVAACILQAKGYEVIGVTMCFNFPGDSVTDGLTPRKPRCCGLQGIEDARRVAHKLGITHYVLNMQKALEERVIDDFCAEYALGRTPNPCVRCNQYVKFGALLKKALSLDAQFLATGHYARVAHTKDGYWLKKAKDLKKDQSYFLYRVGQEELKHLLFPLGNYIKPQVRQFARQFGLSVAEKLESQEICFLPGVNYRDFLSQRLSQLAQAKPGAAIPGLIPGPVVDTQGKVVGRHKGIALYTIGQRKGLGIACGYPVYITRIDAAHNTIVVGNQKDALSSEFLVKDVHCIVKPVKKKVALKVKIRYNHKESHATASFSKGKIKVRFKIPQFAVTPGQSAVFYDKDKVVCGGIIDKVAGYNDKTTDRL